MPAFKIRLPTNSIGFRQKTARSQPILPRELRGAMQAGASSHPSRNHDPCSGVASAVRDAVLAQRGGASPGSSRLPSDVIDWMADRLGSVLPPATSRPSSSQIRRAMRLLRLRPPRHARPLSGVRGNSGYLFKLNHDQPTNTADRVQARRPPTVGAPSSGDNRS